MAAPARPSCCSTTPPAGARQHPLKFLAGYRGRFLQCDAYQSYNALTEIARDSGPWQLVYCWTHVRRRFVKRFENEGSPIAEEMLRQIALLYQVEKTVRGKEASLRLAARREHAAPIIAALKPWLEAQLSRIPQKSQLAEDIRYTLAHWPGLIRFLDDGTLELDTNPVENQIRPIALTRKNALFAGNEVGAENWAMLASLVATCKMSDVNPVDYLAATLRAILDGHPKSRIEELMPWRFDAAVKPRRIGQRRRAYTQPRPIVIPAVLEAELLSRERGHASGSVHSLEEQTTAAESLQAALVAAVPAQTWFDLAAWAKDTQTLQPWQPSLSFSLGRLAGSGRPPSRKQAMQGEKIIAEARTLGFRG